MNKIVILNEIINEFKLETQRNDTNHEMVNL